MAIRVDKTGPFNLKKKSIKYVNLLVVFSTNVFILFSSFFLGASEVEF
jgi:hypothetical protein